MNKSAILSPGGSVSAISGRRGKILVVDDQPVNVHAIHQILAGDYEVFVATNGPQAIAFCNNMLPDIVLLDVVMPEMDGLEVCRQLKQNPETQGISVIFVTSNYDSDDETACWNAGGVDFVNKPVNPVTLRHRVQAHLTLKYQADLLRRMAFADGLTDIPNRRFFEDRLEAEWRRCSRSGMALGLLMIDVDYFKRFNDTYGHQAGDDCLKMVAGALKANLNRSFDVPARYGGEEFVCLLPETDLAGVVTIGALLEIAVRNLQIEHASSDVASCVTISLGAAACYPGEDDTSASLVQMADQQLYRAKQEGRGRVCAEKMDNLILP